MFIGFAGGVMLSLISDRTGVSGQRPDAFAGAAPVFDLAEVLSGDLVSEGIVYDLRGGPPARFAADVTGLWTSEGGVLTEAFRYADGRTQRREWTVTFHDDGRFTATAPDLVGEARGVAIGAGVRMEYRIRLPEELGGHVLDVVDWMILTETGVVLNRSEMRRFSVKVAELFATLRHKEPRT